MRSWKVGLTVIAIIVTVVSTNILITASNISGLREADKEQFQLIYEMKTQTEVLINEFKHVRKEMEEQNGELREIKAILEEINGK